MSGIFETTWSRREHEMNNIPKRWDSPHHQPRPENPEVGTTWIDPKDFKAYVWAEVDHNALDDLVKGVEDQEIKHFDWVPLLNGYLGQNLFGAIVDEVNFMRPEDDDE